MVFPEATVSGLWEHHAVVRLPDEVQGSQLGSVIAVVPNHVCTPVNLADELLVTQGGEVIDLARCGARHQYLTPAHLVSSRIRWP